MLRIYYKVRLFIRTILGAHYHYDENRNLGKECYRHLIYRKHKKSCIADKYNK